MSIEAEIMAARRGSKSMPGTSRNNMKSSKARYWNKASTAPQDRKIWVIDKDDHVCVAEWRTPKQTSEVLPKLTGLDSEGSIIFEDGDCIGSFIDNERDPADDALYKEIKFVGWLELDAIPTIIESELDDFLSNEGKST